MAISVLDINVKHAKYHAVSSLRYSYSSHFKYSEMHTTLLELHNIQITNIHI